MHVARNHKHDMALSVLIKGGVHVTDELWHILGWPNNLNFLFENGDAERKMPTLLLRAMLLMGPPPHSSTSSTQLTEFVRKICLHAESLRESRPAWLIKQHETIFYSTPTWFPGSLVRVLSSYSAPSVEEIWSVQLGIRTHVDDGDSKINLQ